MKKDVVVVGLDEAIEASREAFRKADDEFEFVALMGSLIQPSPLMTYALRIRRENPSCIHSPEEMMKYAEEWMNMGRLATIDLIRFLYRTMVAEEVKSINQLN
jgi:hypothetical protein